MNVALNVERKFLPSLANFFSQSVMSAICRNNIPNSIKYVAEQSGLRSRLNGAATFGEFSDGLFDLLMENYRCEYLYKNVLAVDLLNTRHTSKSTLLTECRVEECKADVVVLNGTSTVYEIKTELDSFARLTKQLEAYRKAFDKIYLVVHHSLLKSIPTFVDKSTGIICMDEKGHLQNVRESSSNLDNVDSGVIFDNLRRSEYLEIIEQFYGEIPDVPNTKIYRECRQLAEKIPGAEMHAFMIKVLHKRISEQKNDTARDIIPRSLRLLYLEKKFTKKEHDTFLNALGSPLFLGN